MSHVRCSNCKDVRVISDVGGYKPGDEVETLLPCLQCGETKAVVIDFSFESNPAIAAMLIGQLGFDVNWQLANEYAAFCDQPVFPVSEAAG